MSQFHLIKMFASSSLEDRSLLRTHRHTYGCLWLEESYLNFPGKFQSYMYSRIVRMTKKRNPTIVKNYLGIIQRLLQKAPRKPPAARKYFLATSKFVFFTKF